jgi:hypothetical protein
MDLTSYLFDNVIISPKPAPEEVSNPHRTAQIYSPVTHKQISRLQSEKHYGPVGR